MHANIPTHDTHTLSLYIHCKDMKLNGHHHNLFKSELRMWLYNCALMAYYMIEITNKNYQCNLYLSQV